MTFDAQRDAGKMPKLPCWLPLAPAFALGPAWQKLELSLTLAARLQEQLSIRLVMVAKRVFYEGRVQGVGFRYTVRSLATGYEVVGWVKNLIDGRVELEVQGDADEVDAFLEAILDSQLRRHISRFVVQEIPAKSGVKGFEIRH